MDIDLTDPRVQQLLAGDTRSPLAPKREVVQLAGDAPDPTGLTDHSGLLSTYRLNAGKQEVGIIYRDMVLTVDVYVQPAPLKIHIICPRCLKRSMIGADRKKIDFDPIALNPTFGRIALVARREDLPELAHLQFGRLSVEAFQCTWEMGNDSHVPGPMHTGASLCRLKLVIDNNRAVEA